MRKVITYPWHTGKLQHPMRLLVISDLHDAADYGELLALLPGADALLMPGDMVNRYKQQYTHAVAFVTQAAKRLPVFAGVGNHEMRLPVFTDFQNAFTATGATLLFNTYISFRGVAIGCWYRPELYGHRDMLPAMEKEPGAKILMCHRPEDYIHRLRDSRVDLVLAGHAHGGQMRIGRQGLYAPGQGIFPKYTYGIVDQKMIISAGASNPVLTPRFRNPCEVLLIELD